MKIFTIFVFVYNVNFTYYLQNPRKIRCKHKSKLYLISEQNYCIIMFVTLLLNKFIREFTDTSFLHSVVEGQLLYWIMVNR